MSTTTAERELDLRLPLAIVGAAMLAAFVPLWALLVGPILFGVPHVIGDVRVLWLARPSGFGGRVALAVALALVSMTALRFATLCGLSLPIEAELACGLAAVAIAAIGGARNGTTRVAWAFGIGALGGLALASARESLLVLAHAHNLVAISLWCVWQRERRAAAVVALVYAVGAAVVVGMADSEASTDVIGSFEGARLARELAPGFSSSTADALLRSFAFAQLVHYGIWSWQLPGGAQRPLRDEIGKFGIALCTVACIAVPLCGLWAPVATRATYLQLAIAHGWIELAVLSYLLARGGAARAP